MLVQLAVANGYSRPNLKVQKKQGTRRAVIAMCYYIEVNKICTFCANFVLMNDCFGPAIIVQSTFYYRRMACKLNTY